MNKKMATENHKVLTYSGWKKISTIKKGEKILTSKNGLLQICPVVLAPSKG